MRICRFLEIHAGCTVGPSELARYGALGAGRIIPIRKNSLFGTVHFEEGESLPLERAQLLAPCEPTKIVAIGRNYREHAAELGHDIPTEPLIFLKPPSAIVGPGDTIRLPAISERVDHEGELVVVIAKRAYKVKDHENPLDYVFGYTCGNDVTARDLQKKDVQFTRAKGFDTFAAFGPVIATELSPSDLQIETRVNGQLRQRARTSDLIFPVDLLIRYISHIMTLLPGDLIYTGTPAGVGPLRPGDTVEVEIEGIATLTNYVVADQ